MNIRDKATAYDKLVIDHNRLCLDVHAKIGMTIAAMSAVKGTPTPTKVALWRSELTEAQALLVTVR